MQDEQLVVKVSGQALYNAVKNYMNNNPDLRKKIDEEVKALVDAGHLQAQLERLVRESFHLNSFSFKRLIETTIKEVITQEVKIKIDTEVQDALKRTFQNYVFVVPKAE